MPALIDITDLTNAGITFETPEQAQYYIDMVSAFVNRNVDVIFFPFSDKTVRGKADYYGTITLVGPVDSVAGVARPNSTTLVPFRFDDIDLVYNLKPNTAYDVTYSGGYAEVPEDIKFFCTEAVRQGLNNPNSALSFRVGDVTETYASSSGRTVSAPITVLGTEVLASYRNTAYTLTYGSLLPVAVQDNPWEC